MYGHSFLFFLSSGIGVGRLLFGSGSLGSEDEVGESFVVLISLGGSSLDSLLLSFDLVNFGGLFSDLSGTR